MFLRNMCSFFLAFFLVDLAFGAKPTEVSVVFDKAISGGSDDKYIGQTEIVLVTIKIPDGALTGVKVELLPSTTETVFAIGKLINKTVGADLTGIQKATWFEDAVFHNGQEYTDESPLFYHTRVAFDIGDITNGGSGTTEEDSYIKIYFEVVLVSLGSHSANTEYWVSCGMAYNDDAYIWISQYSYNLKNVDTGFTSGTSDFNLDTVSTIDAGGAIATTDLTMKLTKARSSVKIEALVLTETMDISPVKIEVISVGAAYEYSIRKEKFLANRVENCAVRETTQQSLELDLGTIVNKESQKAGAVDTDSEIVIRISWMVFNESAVGNEYTLGVGIDVDSTDISVGNFNITVTERTSEPAFSNYTAAADGSSTVEAGGVGILLVSMTIPPGSFNEHVMQLTSSLKGQSTSKLSLLSYSFVSKGENIPCEFENTVVFNKSRTDATNPDVVNAATMTFKILNSGLMANNTYVLKIAFMFMPDAAKDDEYELRTDINGIQQTTDFTVGDQITYDENVAYGFSSMLPQGSRITTGAQFTMVMTVNTSRNTIPGPMTMELPIPDSSAYVKLVKAKTKSKGLNVVCPPSDEFDIVQSSWNDTVADNARSIITLPMVCNIEAIDDVGEDTWEIEFDLAMIDHADLMTNELAFSFGSGVAFSGNQIFVGGETVTSIPPFDQGSLMTVTGVSIQDDPLPVEWPGHYQLQWSTDRENFYHHKLQWKERTSITDNTFELEKPILARYVRLTTPGATGLPAHNITVDTSPIGGEFHFLGELEAVNQSKPTLMFALDDDEETCMTLPLKNETQIPPYFIAQLPTKALKKLAVVDSRHITSSFQLNVVGEGIDCNSTHGPQRTMVWNPSATLTGHFRGSLSKCQFTHGNDSYTGSKTLCQYQCTCTDVDTCKAIILVIVHDDYPDSNYMLCDLSIV